MVIKINNINILLDLKYLACFKSVLKYETKDTPDFVMKSIEGIYSIPECEPNVRTKFYNTYYLPDREVQVQYADDTIVGVIEYIGNTANIYLHNSSFETEYLLTQYAMVHFVRHDNTSLLMHGSSFKYLDHGFILTAKSGTGKSTHQRLWGMYSDRVIINDDKNILSIVDDKLMISSTPWSGKHQLDNNITCTLDAIVILYQNKENVLKQINKITAFKLLLSQLESPSSRNREAWDKIVDRILNLPIYYYGLNMEKEAFDILEKELRVKICQ